MQTIRTNADLHALFDPVSKFLTGLIDNYYRVLISDFMVIPTL